MNLSNLSKEQKQYVVLGVLAVAIVGILIVFGVKVSLSSISNTKDELDSYTRKIEQAERMLSRRSNNDAESRRTMLMLKDYLESAPPDRNYYSWVTEVVYSEAREAGLEIDTVTEIANMQQVADKEAEGVRLESYGLRIKGSGSYEEVKRFIGNMKRDYVLARFVGVDLSVGETPERHDVQLWIQWPFNLGAIVENWESIKALPVADAEVAGKIPSPPSSRIHAEETESKSGEVQ